MPGEAPSKTEIEHQLRLLLASDALAAAPKLSPLLKRIVRDSLSGEAPEEYEYLLGLDLFDRSRDWSPLTDNIVRQNVVNLRGALDMHYRTQGSGDLVIIEIPRRQGFRARFSYNAHAPAAEHCAVIANRFYSLTPCVPPAEARHFIRELRKCIKGDPVYAPAYAHLAEILVTAAVCGPPPGMTSAACIAEAEGAMTECRSIGGDFWLAEMVSGALSCCRFQWKDAGQAFDRAMKIAPPETRGHFWYVAYLAANGSTKEVDQCTKARASTSDPLLDPACHLMTAALYYLRGDYELARNVLALFLVKRVTPLRSYARLFDGKDAPEAIGLVNWLAEALMACIALEQGNNRLAFLYASAALEHGAPRSFEGLASLAGRRNEAQRSARKSNTTVPAIRKEIVAREPVSAALAFLGSGDNARAIACLKRACDEGHPAMAWLHLLPVFSSLRRFKRFNTLLERVKPD